VKGSTFADYILIPDDAGSGNGEDLTGATFKAELRDKPGGTLLETFTVTANSPPPNRPDTAGWVRISLDDGETAALTAYRACWSLLIAKDATNYEMVAAGVANIIRQATT